MVFPKLNMLYRIINLCYLLLLHGALGQKSLNDSCVLQNGKQGKCVDLVNCPGALEFAITGGHPESCGFQGTHPVICCELEAKEKVGDISIADEKCKELYSSPPPTTEGTNVGPAKFLHMVYLGYDHNNGTTWGCAGSLISEKFVLTAAHCITTRDLGTVKYVKVGQGESSLSPYSGIDNAKAQVYNVHKANVHPKYKQPSVYHDIALIELTTNVDFNDFVRPGCLFAETEILTETLSAIGWRSTSFQDTSKIQFQEIPVRKSTFEACQDTFKSNRRLPNGIDKDMHICAGNEGKDNCVSGSGGTLQFKNIDYAWGDSIVGVTSFGNACGSGNGLDVYVRVSHYIDWIESVVWPEVK